MCRDFRSFNENNEINMSSAAIISTDHALQLILEKDAIILDASIDKVNQKLDNSTLELIPNSRFFAIEGAFSDHDSPFPHTLPSASHFEQEVQKIGINQDSVLIIYDRWGIYSSPRAWWMFRYMGLEQVYVLRGGLPAWKAAGLPVEDHYLEETAVHQGNFKANPRKEWLVSKEQLLSLYQDKHVQVIDARSSGRFHGTAAEPRPGLRSGHIPGSKNLPFDTLMDGIDYKEKEELALLFDGKTNPDKRNIFTCGSGVSAAILALAAHELGIEQIAVYDGSWSEWGADPNSPIEQ